MVSKVSVKIDVLSALKFMAALTFLGALGGIGACTKPEVVAAVLLPTIAGNVIAFPGDKDPASLRVAEVAKPADQLVSLTGRLAWDDDHTSRVYAPYSGRVERLLVSVGQRVRRGQALATLSSADIGQAQADWRKAEADQALGRSAVGRARELAEAGVIARKDLEQAEADLARSSAEGARAKARLAQYGVAAGSVTQSLTLSSPIDGIVVERNGNAGGEVRNDVQGAALFTVSDPSTLWAAIDVDERQLSLLSVGQAVRLSAAAWPEQVFSATVLHVGESVDPASRTVKVRARVANAERRLKAEMFVSAQVTNRAALPLVPADAVFLRGDKPSVFVQRGSGRFERREVQLRAAGPQYWGVVAGLGAGERVVVGGALYLNQLLESAR